MRPMPQLIASVEGVEIKHVFLHKDKTTLGRKSDNDIVLDNLSVSGHHCVFQLKGIADVFVEDLGSTNGTFVNNQKVKRQRLHDGDIVAIGAFRIQFLASSGDSGFHETQAMMVDPSGQPASLHASFRVLNGSSAGLEVPVVKAVTTFGKPSICVVSVSHRRTGYFVGYLAGEHKPLLNGQPIGDDPVLLSDHDVLELGTTQMMFQLGA